ncbi:hypothetical protein [Winogradskyella sp. 3972H.M.0a.05]|uniref:hypothetical protein n=1 Tax=Winogradskyella sp. 3972H.M.0a.05 TaxID=2950277 RepID=UPI0033934F17
MKRIVLLLIMSLSISTFGQESEWMTSLDIAKRLALTQNKMLFVMWEQAASDLQTITFKDANGNTIIVSARGNNSANEVIWEHFVPVKLSETNYEKLFLEIKEKRRLGYISKFNDDSVKIMDTNGNILNAKFNIQDYSNVDLSYLIDKYALNTYYINKELRNYAEVKNFTTTFRLASKYMDYAIFQSSAVENEIIDLALIYLDEAKQLLGDVDEDKRLAFAQKCELQRVYQYTVVNRPRKILRELNRLSKEEIYSINQSMFNFLNYISHRLLKDEEEAELWKSKVSLLDLKKSELIITKNTEKNWKP